ncbi:homoserine acetyltransferase [Wolfiporia cocos MD-104 SS10]|uniref:Homoserine acetyltransferase n=1 Tax=Wolfiporia cocos (strain MD-104) TaxID=742152 RepID=A0A2H3K5V1_WOLCO|nr:homoserine acetyltransferase [Wolfiporia cocos MD-104 SS10]
MAQESVDVPPLQYYRHGRFKVAGGVLPGAVTAYQTYGDPNNPCIVFPTCYGAKLAQGIHLIGENRALDPRKYFIVTFALFCNGESSSPSNTPPPYNGVYFPLTNYEDNIRAQYAVLTKQLGVKRVFCALGFSMGGQQAYHWAVVYPDFVDRIVVICSAARTSPHSKWLVGPKNALRSAKDYNDGHYTMQPHHAIRAFNRVCVGWAYGQTWWRQKLYLYDGLYPSLETFIREVWETPSLLHWDANDMLSLLQTWQDGDASQVRDGGDLEQCLRAIKAKVLLLPCKTDLYFCPEDSQNEVKYLQYGQLFVIDSVWGHIAGGAANPADVEFVTARILEFLT